ncbi:MAG: nitrophenyl compound nitroreductase subunit ArsF family protein, partial [Candidatus Diapherotrites archaeon]
MIKKKIAFIIALLAILVISGCLANTDSNEPQDCTDSTACSLTQAEQNETPQELSDIEKIEVYHFHGTNQCYSCKTVGEYAEETIKTYFANELESGKIVFGHINAELPENQELAKKYEVTNASLWIGTYTSDGKFNKEQNSNVWYKIGN